MKCIDIYSSFRFCQQVNPVVLFFFVGFLFFHFSRFYDQFSVTSGTGSLYEHLNNVEFRFQSCQQVNWVVFFYLLIRFISCLNTWFRSVAQFYSCPYTREYPRLSPKVASSRDSTIQQVSVFNLAGSTSSVCERQARVITCNVYSVYCCWKCFNRKRESCFSLQENQ